MKYQLKIRVFLISTLISFTAASQVVKTLNGTVSYRSGMSETNFSTPNGDVQVLLPQSLTGAVISGTVVAKPTGKNVKEKNRNMKELAKMMIVLGEEIIPISGIPAGFQWKPIQNKTGRTAVELKSPSGIKFGEVSLPPVINTPAIINPAGDINLSVHSNIIMKGDALSLYTNQQFTPGKKFVITDSKGKDFTVKPICQSANQAVITLPEGLGPGQYKVRLEEEEVPFNDISGSMNNNAAFTLVDFILASPNTNLRPGEKSSVTINVIVTDSKGEWVNPDIEKLINGTMTINLQNLNPNTVTMEGGNFQRLYLDQSNFNPASVSYHITKTITGNMVGDFSVSATLHDSYLTCNDAFRPQLNALNTAMEFNNWVSELKNDLTHFANLQGSDNMGQAIKSNIRRAIDNIPECSSPEQLDEIKAVTHSLLKPLDIPIGAADSWLSSFKSFETILQGQSMSPNVNSNIMDWDIIRNGMNFIERIGYRTNDEKIIRDIQESRQLVNTIHNNDKQPGRLQQLFEILQPAVQRTKQKLTDASHDKTWSLSDLLFSTYCINKKQNGGIDPYQSMIGYMDPDKKVLRVNPEYQERILNSLKGVPLGNNIYSITASNTSGKPVTIQVQFEPDFKSPYEGDYWAEYLIKNRKSQDSIFGKVISSTKDSTGTWYIFYKDAKCTSHNEGKIVEYACKPFIQSEYVDGERKERETGYYEKYVSQPSGTCLKGNDFCTEVYSISGISYIYMDPKCTRLKTTINYYNFSCL